MWTKEETAKLKQSFWTAFGHYMRPVLGADGEPQKWLNYATGIPGLYFRAFAGGKRAVVGIEITHTNTALGKQQVAQLNALAGILSRFAGEEWHWLEVADRSLESRFYGVELNGISVFNPADWPALISFFKPRLIALDAFWEEGKWGFE